MAGLTQDQFKWEWDVKTRQLFNLKDPLRTVNLTDAEVVGFDTVKTEVNTYLGRPGPHQPAQLTIFANQLKDTLGIRGRGTVRGLAVIPDPGAANRRRTLDGLYPYNRIPDAGRIAAARGRIGAAPAAAPRAPAAAPRPPAVPAVPARPIGIVAPAPLVGDPQLTDNIVLAANPPPLYIAIQDADIRTLTRELADPNYNPEQTFLVAIGDPGGPLIVFPPPPIPTPPIDPVGTAPPVKVELTPLQYASLKALKGTVRFILNNSTSDISKKINGKTIKQAVTDYRKADADKDEIRYMFDVINSAIRDATDDFTDNKDLDTKYGEGANIDSNKRLAKKYYEREYNDLKSPKVTSSASLKTSGTLVDEAKKKGKDDGERGSSKNPEYLPTAASPKLPQEQEAYGKEYDKAFAAYHGKKDGILNESEDIVKIARDFSSYYIGAHKDEVDKLYKNAYNANRSRTSDLAKEAGYVGTYPASQTLLSGNFFGFGTELNKIIGFSTTGSAPVSDIKYKEGFIEFVKNVQSLIGQAKYAGYTDGISKKTKYTTPGKNVVGGKEYSVDFGKLNVQLTTQIVDKTGMITSNPDYWQVRDILVSLRQRRNADTITSQNMIEFLTAMQNRPDGVYEFWLFQNQDISNVRDHFGDDTVASLRVNRTYGNVIATPPTLEPIDNLSPKVKVLLQSVLKEITDKFTKTEIYDKVNQALSIFPEFEEVKVESIPTGKKPDDPALTPNISVTKRVQAMYDREYERGYKEAMRPTGGTRRKTKKSVKFTKKQKSKK